MLYSKGASTIAKELLTLSSWFKHRTYLIQMDCCSDGRNQATQVVDKVVWHFGKLCSELVAELGGVSLKKKDFAQASSHFNNVKALKRLFDKHAAEEPLHEDKVKQFLREFLKAPGQGVAGDEL